MCKAQGRNALVPATDIDWERLRSIRHHEPMWVQTTYFRTSRLHRWYRGLVGKVAEAIDASPDALHAELKFKAGLVEQIMLIPGAEGTLLPHIRLRSTAFPLMDDTRFAHYCDVALELLHRDYFPHIKSRQWQKEVIGWAGRRPKVDPTPSIK